MLCRFWRTKTTLHLWYRYCNGKRQALLQERRTEKNPADAGKVWVIFFLLLFSLLYSTTYYCNISIQILLSLTYLGKYLCCMIHNISQNSFTQSTFTSFFCFNVYFALNMSNFYPHLSHHYACALKDELINTACKQCEFQKVLL